MNRLIVRKIEQTTSINGLILAAPIPIETLASPPPVKVVVVNTTVVVAALVA